jgi:hypothetical protein
MVTIHPLQCSAGFAVRFIPILRTVGVAAVNSVHPRASTGVLVKFEVV